MLIRKFPSPRLIKEQLDRYIVGQHASKKILSVAAFIHIHKYNPYNVSQCTIGSERTTNNLILIGNSGTGKTLLIRRLAQIIQLPIAVADSTSLTQTGYVGGNVEDMVKSLLEKVNYDVEKAQKGIIFVDEFDKIAKKAASPDTRDVGGEGVQTALLKLVEGTILRIKAQAHDRFVDIDTSNILFIFAGAFVGLQSKKNVVQHMGFNPPLPLLADDVVTINHEDIIKYGMIPELVGRIPIIATLQPLTKSEMLDILSTTLYQEYRSLFFLWNVELILTLDAMKHIVDKTMKKEIGARGLKAVVESTLESAMFETPHSDIKQVVVDVINSKNFEELECVYIAKEKKYVDCEKI